MMPRSNPARFAAAALLCCLGVSQGYKFCDDPPDIYNSPESLIIARANCENYKISDPQKCVYKPPGSQIVSIPTGRNGSEELAVFLPQKLDAQTAEHAVIIVPGKLSNAGLYWDRLRNVTENLYGTQFNKTRRKIINVAPLLFTDHYTPNLHGIRDLTWRSPGDWIAGRPANYPNGTSLTSIDALEALVDEFSRRDKYPNLTNITFVGQSAGGQLVQRYAALARDRPSGIHIRYIQNNPATCSYFTNHRPSLSGQVLPSISSCKKYDIWPFGFEKFPETPTVHESAMEYFQRYISRDVVATVGYTDTNPCSGDQTCKAVLQGGHKRRDRNLIWYRYIHELARTTENLTGFPGNFSNLPDWGKATNNSVSVRLAVARHAGHEFQEIFTTNVGLSALFDDKDVLEGWRPTNVSGVDDTAIGARSASPERLCWMIMSIIGAAVVLD